MRALTLVVVALLPSLAQADDAIARAIGATLPPGLALLSVEPTPSLARARAALLEAEWPTAPRAGAAAALVTARRPSGAVVARGWVVAHLAPLRELPVAARALEAGAILGPDDVLLVRRPATDGEPLSIDALVGARLLAPIASGAPIASSVIARLPPLPRGAPITVRVRAGAVVVTAPGLLEQAARPGDLAAIRLTGPSARLVTARLRDDHTAELGALR